MLHKNVEEIKDYLVYSFCGALTGIDFILVSFVT